MAWKTINCPHCKQRKDISPHSKFKACDRCGTPHCIYSGGKCSVQGCVGWLEEEVNR